MPVTITTAKHAPRVWQKAKTTTPSDLFKDAASKEFKNSKQIIQSSFSKEELQGAHVSPSLNGLVYAAYHAYSHHHHLTIRPEDVWFAILSQLNFYINAHAEELRDYFVAHEGQKELTVYAVGSIHTVNFGTLARHMTKEIHNNVKDPDLKAWIMPDFTTTTDSDRAVAAVLMMGAMQKYFSYGMCLMCGIPSVTLLGEREDWEKIHNKLNKLSEFGDEPTNFAEQLRPILRNFISMFDADAKSSPELQAFWGRIADKHNMGSGPTWFSGWITAFCTWDEDGKLITSIRDDDDLELDGVKYGMIDIEKIPAGFASVPVKVDDNGTEYNTKMIAGSFGIQAKSSGEQTDSGNSHADMHYGEKKAEYKPASGTEKPGLDSLQPATGWIMYEVRE
ncbi:hypothetical protein N0V87_006643 [Didymella glomerata]|jgi:hypothetical protein|uniref:Uncharacterized protein n=1 Tax=Didymella glomerata TaxID=749621 RepID=A0A9W9BYC1_9PLEO|nr:hypothetical protein N0V87_006643 [Didymella glomerata]